MRASVLERVDLAGAQLQKAYLVRALLRETNFIGSNLKEAQLQGAYLGGAQLQGAYLGEAQLQGANLEEAQLQGSHGGKKDSKSGFTLFRENIERHREKDAKLDSVVLKGGLAGDDIKRMQSEMNLDAEFWSDEEKAELSEILDSLYQKHLGDTITGLSKKGREMLEEQDAALGSYSQKEAYQWIKEFDEAFE